MKADLTWPDRNVRGLSMWVWIWKDREKREWEVKQISSLKWISFYLSPCFAGRKWGTASSRSQKKLLISLSQLFYLAHQLAASVSAQRKFIPCPASSGPHLHFRSQVKVNSLWILIWASSVIRITALNVFIEFSPPSTRGPLQCQIVQAKGVKIYFGPLDTKSCTKITFGLGTSSDRCSVNIWPSPIERKLKNGSKL